MEKSTSLFSLSATLEGLRVKDIATKEVLNTQGTI